MPMPNHIPVHIIGPLQAKVMEIIWNDPSKRTVHQIHDTLNIKLVSKGEPMLAYTTILTVLRNLAKQKIVTQEHKSGERSHYFNPNINQDEYRKYIANHIVNEFFDGNKQLLVAALG